MKIFVTGASGFVGGEVLTALGGAHDVKALARDPVCARRQRGAGGGAEVEWVAGDVVTGEGLPKACRGCDAAIHLVGIISECGRQTFERVHEGGTANLVGALREAGVRRLAHMSSLGTRPGAPSRYHLTKWAAEECVRGSGLEWTIFRPSVIYGPRDRFVNLFGGMARWSPVLPVMGSGRNQLQPVSVENVARCFVRALEEPRSAGETFDVCGPERLTMAEVLSAILEVSGRKRFLMRVPIALARVQAGCLEWVCGDVLGKPPPLNRDQLLMLQEDNVGDPSAADSLFELRHPTFREGIARYIAG